MVELKTSREIGLLRDAGRVVAQALAAVRERAEVGVTLAELDQVATTIIDKAGATPAFLHYHPSWAPPLPGRHLRQHQQRGRPRHPEPHPAGQR
jgi:methionyl aminopeptidase